MSLIADLKSLDKRQQSAIWASYLGWTLDAFDFFILTLVIEDLAHAFFPGSPREEARPRIALAITLTLAIASALSGRPVRRDIAMTGEVTLRGKVLEIGGVKEKVLAAHRAGVKNIILPKDNEKDLADIPKNVLDTLNVFMVMTMDEVLKIALAEPLAGRRLPAETAAEPVVDDTITH